MSELEDLRAKVIALAGEVERLKSGAVHDDDIRKLFDKAWAPGKASEALRNIVDAKVNFRLGGCCCKFDENDVAIEVCAHHKAEHPERDTLRAEVAALKGLLAIANCPNCDGSGSYARETPCGVEQEQCQWCDERSTAIDAALAAEKPRFTDGHGNDITPLVDSPSQA